MWASLLLDCGNGRNCGPAADHRCDSLWAGFDNHRDLRSFVDSAYLSDTDLAQRTCPSGEDDRPAQIRISERVRPQVQVAVRRQVLQGVMNSNAQDASPDSPTGGCRTSRSSFLSSSTSARARPLNETIFPDTPPTAEVVQLVGRQRRRAQDHSAARPYAGRQHDSTVDAVIQTALKSVRYMRSTNPDRRHPP
jgi:hypothetical protein